MIDASPEPTKSIVTLMVLHNPKGRWFKSSPRNQDQSYAVSMVRLFLFRGR